MELIDPNIFHLFFIIASFIGYFSLHNLFSWLISRNHNRWYYLLLVPTAIFLSIIGIMFYALIRGSLSLDIFPTKPIFILLMISISIIILMGFFQVYNLGKEFGFDFWNTVTILMTMISIAIILLLLYKNYNVKQ